MGCDLHCERHPPHTRWSVLILILVDITNFGEQFVLYTAITGPFDEEIVQDKVQKFFILTILCISALSLLKPLFDDERVNLPLSIVNEIGELITYVILLKGTLYDLEQGENEFFRRFGILVYVVPVCIVQVALLLVSFFCRQKKCCCKRRVVPQVNEHSVRNSTQTDPLKKRMKDFAMEMVSFIFRNSPSVLILYVREESRFRNILVDWLLLVSFFESEIVTRAPHSLCGNEPEHPFDTRVLKYWLGLVQILDICIFQPLLTIMMVVFAGLELSNTQSSNDTLFSAGDPRPEPLPLYERVTSIYTIVSFVIFGILIPFRLRAWIRRFWGRRRLCHTR